MMFLAQSDKWQYRKLLKDFENSHTCVTNTYPQNMVTTFKLINKFKHWQPGVMTPDVQSTAFAQNRYDGDMENNS